MPAHNGFLLPEGTLIIGAKVPRVGVDTVDALQLMNPNVVIGPLVEPYHADATQLVIKNIFWPSRLTYCVSDLDRAEQRLDQQLPSGEVILSMFRSSAPMGVDIGPEKSCWQKWVFAQCPADVARTLRHSINETGLCRHDHVLSAASVALGTLRDMVAKTPIRI